jgi:hypothetical protein
MESPMSDMEFLFYLYTTDKDISRIEGLTSEAKAMAMAKSIKDPQKLIRRTKAHLDKFGPVDNPFLKAMKEMGFTNDQLILMVHPDMLVFFSKYS